LGFFLSLVAHNKYSHPTHDLQEVADDVHLTFKNAMTYNPTGHQVYKLAQALDDVFQDLWGDVLSTLTADELG
jgi:hypothetical protein